MRRFGGLGLTLASPSAFAQEISEPPLRAKLRITFETAPGNHRSLRVRAFSGTSGPLYEGIYDEGSPLSDSKGNRKDVLEAARRLRVNATALAGPSKPGTSVPTLTSTLRPLITRRSAG